MTLNPIVLDTEKINGINCVFRSIYFGIIYQGIFLKDFKNIFLLKTWDFNIESDLKYTFN